MPINSEIPNNLGAGRNAGYLFGGAMNQLALFDIQSDVVTVLPRDGRVCDRCGYIHCSGDVGAIGRFSGQPKFVAKHGHIPRDTRAEADYDECTWRVSRNIQPPPVVSAEKPIIEVEAIKPLLPSPPFPAAEMETAAREKAWLDFLSHANFSLMVWQIDSSIHGSIEAPTAWLSRCCNELLALVNR